MFFQTNLKILMERYQISSKRLAELLGVGDSAVSSYIKRNVFPQMRVVFKIADILNTDLDTLFFSDLRIKTTELKESKSVESVGECILLYGENKRKEIETKVVSKEENLYREIINGRDREIELLKEMIKYLEEQLKLLK